MRARAYHADIVQAFGEDEGVQAAHGRFAFLLCAFDRVTAAFTTLWRAQAIQPVVAEGEVTGQGVAQ